MFFILRSLFFFDLPLSKGVFIFLWCLFFPFNNLKHTWCIVSFTCAMSSVSDYAYSPLRQIILSCFQLSKTGFYFQLSAKTSPLRILPFCWGSSVMKQFLAVVFPSQFPRPGNFPFFLSRLIFSVVVAKICRCSSAGGVRGVSPLTQSARSLEPEAKLNKSILFKINRKKNQQGKYGLVVKWY